MSDPKGIQLDAELMKRPEGTITFVYTSDDLLDPDSRGGVIFQIAAGVHVFRLERTPDFRLRYYYASPGAGTRVASLDLKHVPRSRHVYVAITWAPMGTGLHLGPLPQGQLYSAQGMPSERRYRVTKDGRIVQIGDEGVEVLTYSYHEAGKALLTATALEAWKATKQAVEWLLEAQSAKGYMFEVVLSNLILATLVTGFEAYTKRRFLELEAEGLTPDTETLLRVFLSKKEREAMLPNIFSEEALERQQSLLTLIVERGMINFQNFDACKRAYKRAWGIRFGRIGVESDVLAAIQRYIRYRHRIIHVSPVLGLLNQGDVPPAEPKFASKELAARAREHFDQFITRLHSTTLELRPS